MTTINVSLPDELSQFIQAQAKLCGFDGADAYVRAFVARAKQGSERLESLLIEGLDSGEPVLFDATSRESMRRQTTTVWAE
jgi:antitoxin ParD1/3/4